MELKYGIKPFYPSDFQGNPPFDHIVLDGFFDQDVARKLESEFPDFESDVWHEYHNAIEVKKTCNNYNQFGPFTYKVIAYLNSPEFIRLLEKCTGISPLFSDPGLNGGGWHAHSKGGKLNHHLDYNIHPKMGLQRKLNLIVYLNESWQDSWGGALGLWSARQDRKGPEDLVRTISPMFNRAVLFDTTQKSWHGLVGPVIGPEDQCRLSIAIYYLTLPSEGEEQRGKALFAPTEDQKTDVDVLNLIEKRSRINRASSVYKTPIHE